MNATDHGPCAPGLGDILRGRDATLEERVSLALHRAPFWVIALMAHVIVGAIMGLMYFREVRSSADHRAVEVSVATTDDATKIDESRMPEPPRDVALTGVPLVEVAVDPASFDITTVTEDLPNPYAQFSGPPGLAEGDPDAALDSPLTLSKGGFGQATAIGVGAGGHRGGGGRKGHPFAGGRNLRRNEQISNLKVTEKSVAGGLDWLKRHQNPDGSWDPGAFTGQCEDATCHGKGSSAHAAGLTGLAVLTYLGAGWDTQQLGPYRDTIRNGLKWLVRNQDAEGCFGTRADHRFTYSHACAALAMCEAASITSQTMWRKAAQRGLEFLAACQNPYQGWRYGKRPGDNDVSVTGWMLMALKAGKDAGLEVSDAAMKQGIDFVNALTDPDTGRTGYTRKGEVPVRPEGLQDRWPGAESESLTAVAMCSRIFTGTAERDVALMKAGAELLAKRLPVWDENGGKIDMYYWYYGTMAMHQMGGQEWDRWNKAIKVAAVDHQVKDGCARGSWEPKDPWSDDGGRVYATCLMTLSMEVYYRYPRVLGVRK